MTISNVVSNADDTITKNVSFQDVYLGTIEYGYKDRKEDIEPRKMGK